MNEPYEKLHNKLAKAVNTPHEKLITNEDIARRLGWTVIHSTGEFKSYIGTDNGGHELPNFLTDIGAAWMLIREAERRNFCAKLLASNMGNWEVMFVQYCDAAPPLVFKAQADTAPEAICKAFMAATE